MALAKITFKIIEKDKAAIDPLRGLPAVLEAAYNPAKYTLNKAAQYAEINIPGLDSPILQYVRGQNEKLSLEPVSYTHLTLPTSDLV